MTVPVLSVEGLNIAFRRDRAWQPVVHDLSLSVGAGETLAIVGESGSGKSVTALSLMRLLPPGSARVEGRILLGDRDLATLPEREMRKVRGDAIAMIFQEPMTSLNPVRTIGFQVAEAIRLHRPISAAQARAEALHLLERVRIPGAAARFHDYPHRLSGGQRQRVMIAMALAGRPRLLIADEPTTALDVTIQAQILDLIRELQREEGMAVLFITHDMGVVAQTADRVAVMLDGRLVESRRTADLFHAPAHPYTSALLGAVPRLGAMRHEPWPRPFPVIDRVTGETRHPPLPRDTVDHGARPVLDVANLTTRFRARGGAFRKPLGRVHAVENVSFSIQPGETLALVGESGCGKSTTGRSILKLVTPEAGSVRIDGEDILALEGRALRDLRRRAQIIFQDPFASLDPRMAVGDSIAAPLLAHGLASRRAARDQAAALMEQVGLSPDMARRLPHEFSGGQRQRICIARALAPGPRLIVADEAVSALDVSVKAQIVNLMLDLQESLKLAWLFISHDMAVVERVSHRVAVMHRGEIVEIGPRAAVFGNPQHPYTASLIAAVPVPDPTQQPARIPTITAAVAAPVHPEGHVVEERPYRQAGPGHFVQIAAE